MISIHALREEGDRTGLPGPSFLLRFLSTPSARRATGRAGQCPDGADISIHALREEGDAPARPPPASGRYFYPRPPRGGRRSSCSAPWRVLCHFYPRSPRGGRPPHVRPLWKCPKYFYPRPPRGGRPEAEPARSAERRISIHALREEGDPSVPGRRRWYAYFYPRPPRGGRLADLLDKWGVSIISIHALREEGDGSCAPSMEAGPYFYPRPPRGGRPLCKIVCRYGTIFLSTPSARRATSEPCEW